LASKRVPLLVIAFVLVVALAVSMAVVGTRVTTLASSLARIVDFSEVIEKDVSDADLQALAGDLEQLDVLTQEALVAASDPVLGATLDGLPFVGDHLQAARAVASAAAGLTTAARPLSEVLPRLEPQELVVDGRYDVDALRDLDTVMQELETQLGISNKQIASIDLAPLDERFVEVIDSVSPALDDAEHLLAQLEPLIRILPIVLADEQERTWFIALQNLTEARGTGGLLGSYAVLNVDDGAIALTASGSDRDLIPTVPPTTGLPNSFVEIWGANINEWRSVNVSPHFPYTGRLIANTWEEYSGHEIDGVLAFGQGIVQYMLAATGPITIDGTTVDASNVTRFLSLGVYETYPDAEDKNAFVAQLVAEIFSRLQSGEFDLESLLSATAATPTNDRLLAWAKKKETQELIVEGGYASELPTDYGPTAALAINNGGGNKLEQFLNVTVDYSLGACDTAERVRESAMTVTLTNNAPTSGLPDYLTPREDQASVDEDKVVGSNLEVVSVYLPVGAEEGDTTLDGEDQFGYVGTERDRDVLVFSVDLDPGQTSTLLVEWTEPTVGDDVIDVLDARQTVLTQPSLNPIVVSTPAAEACPAG
jgi:hypothetical protein